MVNVYLPDVIFTCVKAKAKFEINLNNNPERYGVLVKYVCLFILAWGFFFLSLFLAVFRNSVSVTSDGFSPEHYT